MASHPRQPASKPGQSGNPLGRPKGAKNKLPGLSEERLKIIVIEEAYRTISVRDGEKIVSIPIAKAIVRSLAVSAKGNNRAAQLFTQLLKIVEQENKDLFFSSYRSALDYKDAWNQELRRREKLSLPGPEPIPHPDDIVINARTGQVQIIGPHTEAEKEYWEVAEILKAKLAKTVTSIERKLRKNPDHPERAKLLKELNETNRNLSWLKEVFQESVACRLSQNSKAVNS